MFNASTAYRQKLLEDSKVYDLIIDVELTDGTELTFTNEELWKGGLSFDDAVSSDGVFEVGAAIINSYSFIINNIDDEYTQYDFYLAEVTPYIGLELSENNTEYLQRGVYIVDDTSYNGSTIKITALDKMSLLDKPYDTNLSYPATLSQIVTDLCTKCGVTLASGSTNFPHKTYSVSTKPSADSTTYRDVISWVAQIAGCYAKFSNLGYLELKWYNQSLIATTPELRETLNDIANFIFNDYKTYSWQGLITSAFINANGLPSTGIVNFSGIFSHTVGVDDVVITGVKVDYEVPGENTDSSNGSYLSGTNGYVVSIENNFFVQSLSQATQVAGWLGTQLVGFTYRIATVSHLSDPTIEPGDVGFLVDRKGNIFPVIVSGTSFKPGSTQNTRSSGATPARNSAARYSAETKNYVRIKEIIKEVDDYYQNGLDELSDALDSKAGLYTTIQTAVSGNTYYMHDELELEDSTIVWKMTNEAWGVSTDGGQTWNGGMTINGDVIARYLSADGVNANWIRTGIIQDQNHINYWNLVTGEFQLTDGSQINSTDVEGTDFWYNGSWYSTGELTNNNARMRSIVLPSNVVRVSSVNDYVFCVGAWSGSTYVGYVKTDGTVAGGTGSIKWMSSFDVEAYREDYPNYSWRVLVKDSLDDASDIDMEDAMASVYVTTTKTLSDTVDGFATADDLDDLVTSCVVEYCLTTTNTAPSSNTTGWSPVVAWQKGKYLWSHTKTVTQDGTTTYTNPILMVDTYGNSVTVSSVVTEWAQTTTNSAPASGSSSWSSTQPSYVYGRYVWTRSKITYEDGSTSTTSAVLANTLNRSAEDTWKDLTDNGDIDGIYRHLNTTTNKYELYLNASCIGSGILRSNDTGANAPNFRLDLATGQMDMKKGSISLGAIQGSGYNFALTDQGQMTMKSGSIELGAKSNDHSTNYFKVGTTGALEWDLANSQMTSSGVLTTTGANIQGTFETVSGDYKTNLSYGKMKVYNGSDQVGQLGAMQFQNNKQGFDIDIGIDADYGGFYVQKQSGQNAVNGITYDRDEDEWTVYQKLIAAGGFQAGYFTYDSTNGAQINGENVATEDWVEGQDYATETWVENKGYLTQHQSLSGYATQSWVNQQGFLKQHQSLSGYATQQWVQSQGYITSASLPSYAGLHNPSVNYTAKTGIELDKISWEEAVSGDPNHYGIACASGYTRGIGQGYTDLNGYLSIPIVASVDGSGCVTKISFLEILFYHGVCFGMSTSDPITPQANYKYVPSGGGVVGS